MPPHSLDDVLKWGALSANIVSEEPIDVVLHEAYPGGFPCFFLPLHACDERLPPALQPSRMRLLIRHHTRLPSCDEHACSRRSLTAT